MLKPNTAPFGLVSVWPHGPLWHVTYLWSRADPAVPESIKSHSSSTKRHFNLQNRGSVCQRLRGRRRRIRRRRRRRRIMRSRFLNVDYFSSRSSIGTLNRFQFLPLPVPLPSPDPFPSDLDISLGGICIDHGITLDFDPFPIEDALSQFLSDVIPKTLPAAEDGGSLRINPRKKRFRSLQGVLEDNKVIEAFFLSVFPISIFLMQLGSMLSRCRKDLERLMLFRK